MKLELTTPTAREVPNTEAEEETKKLLAVDIVL